MESSSKKTGTKAQPAKVTSGEKAFITFLITYVVDTNPGDLYINL
jgi:hypothetical protein